MSIGSDREMDWSPCAGPRPPEDQPAAAEAPAQLVEHFFRHESGRLVSVLARVFGLRNLDLVEDMVQSALVEALQAWRTQGIPDNPSAWMHRVARNKVVDALRHRETLLRLAPSWSQLRPLATEPIFDDLLLDSQIEDSQLRLMFACCHPALARENQIALTLKALCGFSNAEIARGLLLPEETVKKRIQRARQQLVEQSVELSVPTSVELAGRLDSVRQCLYLLFNEGYAASSGEMAIRQDLCGEAVRLCHLLCSQKQCRSPATFALLALMLFHAARFGARTDTQGRLLLLEDQDRTKWDPELISRAKWFLDQSAEGTTVSRFHLEAGIALLHCSAECFAQTNWSEILRLYDALVTMRPSAIYVLNRAIVLAHLEGPEAGIRVLESLAGDPSLRHYHLYDAALGELHRRAGNLPQARRHFERARAATDSVCDRELLDRKLAACKGDSVRE
jgi:RNA polymerase sigma-70 factor (ECF subfamily)